MSQDVRNLFRELADSDEDYVDEGGRIVFSHHGNDHEIAVSHVPKIGAAIRRPNTSDEWISVDTFVQKEILKLPVLARQIGRALQRKHEQQKIKSFIDGPAQVRESDAVKDEPSAKDALKQILQIPQYACTQLVELMAPAGQGKTVLLEHLAIEAASSYQPERDPVALLLVVDLLGRYVGTIHDAIAGSLSNTYQFPGLTGRDVELCLRQRWLNLALDGFDELVARVGTREAFLRAKELVDDLQDAGTVILSARDTFFQLFEIDASIRTYLQPKRGSYAISEVNLKPWGSDQVKRIFSLLGSRDSNADLSGILQVFGDDSDLVYRPFFATRLAGAWIDGERFAGVVGTAGNLDRWDYVIRIFLEREVTEKWRNREDGLPLLSLDGHITMLGAVAEEMWRSGAFSLTREEVELAGRIGLNDLRLSPTQVDDFSARLPTHGLLAVTLGKSVKFLQDSFFYYLLGQRLGMNVCRRDPESVSGILRKGELPPVVVQWAIWRIRKDEAASHEALVWLLQTASAWKEHGAVPNNLGQIFGAAAAAEPVDEIVVQGAQFFGEALRGVQVQNVRFSQCAFWVADLSQTRLANCEFDDCQFENVRLDRETSLAGSLIKQNCRFGSIEIADHSGLFDPAEILLELRGRGANVEENVVGKPTGTQHRRNVSTVVIRCLDKFRRAKTWDIALDDLEDRLGTEVRRVAQLAVQCGVMRESSRDTSGGRKTFYRFTVDRERLFAGQLGTTGDQLIDAFWEMLEREMPGTEVLARA